MIQNSSEYVTSGEIAAALNVSSRTIRNDIIAMNEIMEPFNARINSTNSKGFVFEAEDSEKIRQLSRIDAAFFTREERVRYLAFRLCESDEPINLYDLEEEIFISHSALLSDIQSLKKKYSYGEPNIRINIHGNSISIEKNELKIRLLLLNLFHHDWDYNSDINAYYNHDFLDIDLLNLVTEKTPSILIENGIQMDDPTLKALELLLVIMHERFANDHVFPVGLPQVNPRTASGKAVLEIFGFIEEHTGINYSDSEKNRIWEFISNVSLSPQRWVTGGHESVLISPFTVKETRAYLEHIRDFYGVDFSKDAEFVEILQMFLQQLLSGHTTFQQFQDSYSAKEMLTAEFELAWLFQYRSMDYMQRYLQEPELNSLAICFSGAIRHYLQENPDKKLRVVLFSHRNMVSAWALKRKILESYNLYLDIKDMLPVNFIDNYDFNDVDLVLTTVNKPLPKGCSVERIVIDDGLEASPISDTRMLKLQSFNKIWKMPPINLEELLRNSFCHENAEITEELRVIEIMMQDFISAGIATGNHLLDISKREALSSYGMKPGLVFVYSILPANETRVSILTLKHRIRWNGFRVSTVVMATFTEEERNLLFHLKIFLCNRNYDPDILRQLKKRDELVDYLIT